MIAIVDGTAPAERTESSAASAVSKFTGHGRPCVMRLDSSATTGRCWRMASAISGRTVGMVSPPWEETLIATISRRGHYHRSYRSDGTYKTYRNSNEQLQRYAFRDHPEAVPPGGAGAVVSGGVRRVARHRRWALPRSASGTRRRRPDRAREMARRARPGLSPHARRRVDCRFAGFARGA